jgi:hypothetical protein
MRLRRWILATSLLLLLQMAIGMAVNLYVTVPGSHPGSRPGDYLTGSARSVAWAIGNGAAALAVHAALGLALVAAALTVTAMAFAHHARATAAWTLLAAGLIVGAGFNGASFLDFGRNYSSLLMALLAIGALGCYLIALAPGPDTEPTQRPSRPW